MGQIHTVLDKLYDGEYEVGVAQPTEDIVEDAQIFILNAARDTMTERRKDDTMNVGILVFDGPCDIKGVIVSVSRHANHQVDVDRFQHILRFLNGTHLRERRRIAQTQFHILIVNLLFHTPVVLKHERIVWVCHDEHIIYTPHHQVDERHILKYKLIPFCRYLFHIFFFYSLSNPRNKQDI